MNTDSYTELLIKYTNYLKKMLEENDVVFEDNFEKWSRRYGSSKTDNLETGGPYCQKCGELLSEHFVNERGEGWCE